MTNACRASLSFVMSPILAASVCLWLLSLPACSSRHEAADTTRFSTLDPAQTGIEFENRITEDDTVNLLVNEYTYMGSGVGIGDFNNDGLPDIFFAAAQGSSKLYLNKGHMKFEDITKSAGVTTHAWCTGVSVVDINHDGWPDIYVCVSGMVPGGRRKNLLFVNQHDLTFREEAEDYGLADSSFSTQAVFFDYDKDGDLDMYLVNHALGQPGATFIRDTTPVAGSPAADRLYRNEGTPHGLNHPVYKDVTREAGISEDGYGLGVVVSDFDGDGYPDIYVANDYLRNDLLWLNNRQGGFNNCIASAIRHQSYSSMGADAADINNDGLPDIATLDMLPENNGRKKMMFPLLNYERYQQEMSKGYQPEFVRNMLQLNNGDRLHAGRQEPCFSEIGQMAGIFETDWSWSVLMADFDNDGWKDMFISNGMGRDLTNADFAEYRMNALNNPEGFNEVALRRSLRDTLDQLGSVPLRSYLFHNNGDLTFTDVSVRDGITGKSISNGAVYVDLDNDGDLDIVTNNINSPATVLQNNLNTAADDNPTATGGNQPARQNNFLTLTLKGDSLNRDGIGTVIYSFSAGRVRMAEQYPVRGYMSSMDNRLHLGLGSDIPDSLLVIWPDGKLQVIRRPAVNTFATIRYTDAGPSDAGQSDAGRSGYIAQLRDRLFRGSSPVIFTDITNSAGIEFRHRETVFNDFAYQPLLPQKFSQEGPFISAGDLNGDGLQDFFIGGAHGQSGRVFIQRPGGGFEGKDLVKGAKEEEDMQSAIFDADHDGHPDLLIASGSTEFRFNPANYRLRFYHNDGKGNLTRDPSAVPEDVVSSTKCIAAGDYDGDGYTDIFVGGRVTLGQYPDASRSFLLRNDHGKFKDVTDEVAPDLRHAGLVTAALWADIDGDGKPELLLSGEWTHIRIFKYVNGHFADISDASGLMPLNGLWRSLALADIDHDGDLDIVGGNIGLNQPFHIDSARPAQLLAGDFDENGIIDPILCYFIKDDQDSFRFSAGIIRDEWAKQVPSIKKRFDQNAKFAKASVSELLPAADLGRARARVLTCNETRSGWFENDGKGHFRFHPFPVAAQIAPINAILVDDFDGDGNQDILLAGNEYQYNVSVGRMDASYGLLLKGDGKGGFAPMPPLKSGLMLDGDIRDLKEIRVAPKRRLVLAAVNDDQLRVLQVK
jgi:hypothetical protein